MEYGSNRSEPVRRDLTGVVTRTGPWTSHNIEVAPGVFTKGDQISGEELKLRRITQLVRDLVGRPLEGLRALDLGALEGLYGIELALAGMEVVFVEGRDTSAEKIRFARRSLGIERGAVYTQDVRELSLSTHGQFDVILCIGLLYHLELESVLELLTTMRELCTGAAVIDTHIALEDEELRRAAGELWIDADKTLSPIHTVEFDGQSYRGRNYLEHDAASSPESRTHALWASLDNETSFWPTKTSLANALIGAGFTSVLECLAPPLPGLAPDRVMLAAIPGKRHPLSSSSIMADVEYEPLPEDVFSEAPPSEHSANASQPRQPGRRPTTRFLPGPLKRLRGLLRELQGLSRETRDLTSAVRQESQTHTQQLAARLDAQDRTLSDLGSRLEGLASGHEKDHEQVVEILRFVRDHGQRRRRQLRHLRADPSYEQAFRDPQPLISVVIPTYDNYALLRDRSIPSVLNQSYQNFEVVVVGDAAPEQAREVVEEFEDPRITFFNLPYRGPYPDDPHTSWLVSGVPPTNEAVRRARGLWIAPLADDDAFRPRHLERLLERARADRLELAYSRLCVHFAIGSETTIGCFPPERGEFGMQSAIYEAKLKDIFEYDLADAALGLPEDWAFCLRMMEAGVRIGMLDEVTVDHYPSRSWTPRWEGDVYGPQPDHHEPQPSEGDSAL